jgi:hypothetical protein
VKGVSRVASQPACRTQTRTLRSTRHSSAYFCTVLGATYTQTCSVSCFALGLMLRVGLGGHHKPTCMELLHIPPARLRLTRCTHVPRITPKRHTWTMAMRLGHSIPACLLYTMLTIRVNCIGHHLHVMLHHLHCTMRGSMRPGLLTLWDNLTWTALIQLQHVPSGHLLVQNVSP